MEQISIFDMLKIGIGPSSSHTLGPWVAANMWMTEMIKLGVFDTISAISVELYGSLSMTGVGHATDKAIVLGLMGEDPKSIEVNEIPTIIKRIQEENILSLNNKLNIAFNISKDIYFRSEFLAFHPNGIVFTAVLNNGKIISETYFSVGGGFVVKEGESYDTSFIDTNKFEYPISKAQDLLDYCESTGMSISEIVTLNERKLKSVNQIDKDLLEIWNVMIEAIYVGCHTSGFLPGSIKLRRRAYDIHKEIMNSDEYSTIDEWFKIVRDKEIKFNEVITWISCFALAVNEVNAALGRVVTAPTNGSAGVIPSVLLYYLTLLNKDGGEKEIIQFLKVAGEIGSIFKKGSTISAALGGCQAEIGVSSAMAAAALTEVMGGTPQQVMVAAEIAMEHHLGLTCDPIDGLVQVPCIERNAMGAVKAVTAAELALHTRNGAAHVPLDKVIETMWETAQDMHQKYKETSTGGLALTMIPDC